MVSDFDPAKRKSGSEPTYRSAGKQFPQIFILFFKPVLLLFFPNRTVYIILS